MRLIIDWRGNSDNGFYSEVWVEAPEILELLYTSPRTNGRIDATILAARWVAQNGWRIERLSYRVANSE